LGRFSRRKIKAQKEDKYNSSHTAAQRQNALAVVSKLAQDIDERYAFNKEKLRKKVRCPTLPGPEPPTSATDFLKYRLPPDLRPGASFTLWPARTFGTSTALRLHDRGLVNSGGINRSPSSVSGSTLGGGASADADAVTATRWEFNGPPT
jgi:hypothetical protein